MSTVRVSYLELTTPPPRQAAVSAATAAGAAAIALERLHRAEYLALYRRVG